jgi:hypothetical protein
MEAVHVSMNGVIRTMQRWMAADAGGLLRSSDPATRLRRYLPEQSEDGKLRWHPHSQMSFTDLDNSGRFVTRPQLQQQMRAERRRDIERQVVERMERDLERSVTAEEAWPEVEPLLRAEGLL